MPACLICVYKCTFITTLAHTTGHLFCPADAQRSLRVLYLLL